MTNKQRILQMVERWPDDISLDEALYHVYVLKKIDLGLQSAGLKGIDSGGMIKPEDFFDRLQQAFDEESAAAILAKIRPTRGTKPTRKSAKNASDSADDPIFCRSCNRSYKHTSLVRQSKSFPGIRRPGGGPNGARRETWQCCPKGHQLVRVSLRVS